MKELDNMALFQTSYGRDRSGLALSAPVNRVRSFLEENCHEGQHLEHLAGLANMSKYHFTRRFKAETGMTCRQYLSFVRLSKAMGLLRTTRLSVSEICYEVGYGDLTHFERVFKKHTCLTPTEFRRNLPDSNANARIGS